MFYAFTSFLYPTTIFRHEFATGRSTVFKAPEIAFDPSPYETIQVFYRSKDGTRAPLFLTYKKGLKKDGSNPTYLYAYGGFNINMTPGFSIGVLDWLEMGGVYAQAVLRGGPEQTQVTELDEVAWHTQTDAEEFVNHHGRKGQPLWLAAGDSPTISVNKIIRM